jgi:bacteriocin-like protein
MLKELNKKEMQTIQGSGPVATGVGVIIGVAIVILTGISKDNRK